MNFHQEQVLRITGRAGDGKRYVALECMVATVNAHAIKVWPLAEEALADDGLINTTGKLWFEFPNIEMVEEIV